MDKALQSLVAPAIESYRVIPNGVDTRIFHPINKQEARKQLGLPQDSHILLFSSYNATRNSWKDYATIRSAIGELKKSAQARPIILVVLGDSGATQACENFEIRFIPFESDLQRVASWYGAADLYVHASRADTFPNSILEAMACGTSVIATAVGGIPEQIHSLDWFGLGRSDPDEATGVLTPPADHAAMALAIKKMLADDTLRHRLARNSIRAVESRFTLTRQCDEFLDWYRELIEARSHKLRSSPRVIAAIST